MVPALDCPAGTSSTAGGGTCNGTPVSMRAHGARRQVRRDTGEGSRARNILSSFCSPPMLACPVNQYSVAGGLCTACQANAETTTTGSSTCRCKAGYRGSGSGPTLTCTGAHACSTVPIDTSGRLILRWLMPRLFVRERLTACTAGTYAPAGSTSCTCTGTAVDRIDRGPASH